VTNQTTPAPAPSLPTDEELVAEFNALYADWDPDNYTSSLGLMYSVGSPLDTRCHACDTPASDCRVSAALLNSKISVAGKNMLFRQGTVGGFLYWPETVAPMVMCSYGMDGATAGRINHGCGCEAQSACIGNEANCPSACENKDPQTGNEFVRNSSMFKRCHCRPGDSLDGHCFWEGPSFYHGHGNDELRSMVKQRHQFMGSAATEWNEVVIDSQAHDQSLRQNAAGLIAAFVIPVNSMCNRACIRELLAIRDATTQQLNLVEPLPVVGLNVDGGDAPFEVFDPFTPSPGPSPGPAPHGSCCWGGSSCETAQNCHGDAFCGQGESQCIGSCAGVWCAQAFV
jgi:hypothetical protein